MLKSRVVERIMESCRHQDAPRAGTPVRPGTRSPAAGGGLTGGVRAGAAHHRTLPRDPSLGQSLRVPRSVRRRSRRS
jgi:hypothetical protein